MNRHLDSFDNASVAALRSWSTDWPRDWPRELARQSRRRRTKRADDESRAAWARNQTADQVTRARAELAGAWRWQAQVISTDRS